MSAVTTGPREQSTQASLCRVPASLHRTQSYKLPKRVQIMKRLFTGAGLSIHVEPVARVALAVEGARGADAAVLAAVLSLRTHVHPCRTERASEWCQARQAHGDPGSGMCPVPVRIPTAPALPAPALTHRFPVHRHCAVPWGGSFSGEAASPSALLLARAATPNTRLRVTFWPGGEQTPGPPLALGSSGSHPPQSLSWNCLANCWMSSKDSTRKTCSSRGGEAMARRELMSALWMPTA